MKSCRHKRHDEIVSPRGTLPEPEISHRFCWGALNKEMAGAFVIDSELVAWSGSLKSHMGFQGSMELLVFTLGDIAAAGIASRSHSSDDAHALMRLMRLMGLMGLMRPRHGAATAIRSPTSSFPSTLSAPGVSGPPSSSPSGPTE